MTAAVRECQVRLAGAGGQGIVLAGLLLAEAAVAAGKNATHAQAYGPESRGGSTKADVIVSEAEIDYPYATEPNVLLALTQEACDRYAPELPPGSTVLVDERIERHGDTDGLEWRSLPIFATARQRLGGLTGANIVALGALAGVIGLVPREALESAIRARPPGGRPEPNLQALQAGLDLVASPNATRG